MKNFDSYLNLKPLILASSSPRRSEILQAVGWPFEKLPVDLDETIKTNESPASYVERLALEKAQAAASKISSGLTLGADTTVVVDSQVLGKPRDEDDAHRMLKSLSGRWHEVLTGVALVQVREEKTNVSAVETTRVKFADMTDEEIAAYITTKEPMDKAGAYAIQGRAALFIEKIEGDYWNVMGLPIRLVYNLMKMI
jgi:septum formation protein